MNTTLWDTTGPYTTPNRVWDEDGEGTNITMLCAGCGEWREPFRGERCPDCVEASQFEND